MAACTACGRPHAADRPCPERGTDDRVGQIVGAKYRVVRHIGEGGMASVYEARHVEIQRPFALKFLHPWLCADEEWLERFRREAAAGGALISEHITAIVDIGLTPDETPYIVMEYLTGEDLGQRLAREITLKPSDAIEIIIQACCGLGVAHAGGVVHRDLKPENLFLCDRQLGGNVVKILDFGIAKLRNAQAQVTRAGMVIGTPFYMSPEQAAGRWDVDHRSDIYALGVILYELLAGEKPFVGESHSAVLSQIINGPAPSLREQCPTVSAELAVVAERAMAKSARDRYQTAAEFAEALHVFSPQARRSSRTANGFGSRASWRALSAPSMTVAEPNLTVRLSGPRQRVSSPGLLEAEAANADSSALEVAKSLAGDFDEHTSVDAFVEAPTNADVEPPKARARAHAGSYPAPPDIQPAGLVARRERTPGQVSLGRTLLPLVAGVAAIVFLVASFSTPSKSETMLGAAGAVVAASNPAVGAAGDATELGQQSESAATAASPNPAEAPVPGNGSGQGTPEVSSVGALDATGEVPGVSSAQAAELPPGLLNVHSEPSAELLIGGKSRGRTPIIGLHLPPGEYPLLLVEPGRGRRIKTVRIQSRQLTAVTVRFDDLAQALAPESGAASTVRGAATTPPAPSVTAAVRSCSPKFFVDSEGVRRLKPECLF